MCECKSFRKKEGRWVNIQKKQILRKKILVVSYCVNVYWSSFRKYLILMSFFKIFSNEKIIVGILDEYQNLHWKNKEKNQS